MPAGKLSLYEIALMIKVKKIEVKIDAPVKAANYPPLQVPAGMDFKGEENDSFAVGKIEKESGLC
ncbi:MAG: hypothetical protein QM278_09915 [Pseudomonadota bacterium]|nr:hypothetical protein [Pseudomonadota bacterium]